MANIYLYGQNEPIAVSDSMGLRIQEAREKALSTNILNFKDLNGNAHSPQANQIRNIQMPPPEKILERQIGALIMHKAKSKPNLGERFKQLYQAQIYATKLIRHYGYEAMRWRYENRGKGITTEQFHRQVGYNALAVRDDLTPEADLKFDEDITDLIP